MRHRSPATRLAARQCAHAPRAPRSDEALAVIPAAAAQQPGGGAGGGASDDESDSDAEDGSAPHEPQSARGCVP